MTRLGAAQPVDLPLLEHAQQLDLRGQVDVADLVQEQRAAVGQLEAALLARLRARERALLEAEQLGFDQRVWQRRATDLDERLASIAASCSAARARSAPCRCLTRRG